MSFGATTHHVVLPIIAITVNQKNQFLNQKKNLMYVVEI